MTAIDTKLLKLQGRAATELERIDRFEPVRHWNRLEIAAVDEYRQAIEDIATGKCIEGSGGELHYGATKK